MFETTIEVNETIIKMRLGLLADQSGAVIARAANRAYPMGKKVIAQAAAKKYRIRQKDINNKRTLKLKAATSANPTVTLEYTGGHRNLAWWDNGKAVSPRTIIQWSHGRPNVRIYRAAVEKGRRKVKLFGSDNDKNRPFIQRVRKGERSDFTGLFRRVNARRDSKIVSVQAPAVPQILKNESIMGLFQRTVGPQFQRRLDHEIDMVLKGVVK